MTRLKPLPFDLLIQRTFQEYEHKKSIFALPERYFYRPGDFPDFSCTFRGQKATTPLGPAAGPHTQMAQNIVCAWLSGSRIIELKTIQVMDTLEIPTPCIDVSNVCYNVEWSQELTVSQSILEYVKAWYLIEILRLSKIAGIDEKERQTLFDLSVGYDLKGIQGEKVMGFINTMKDATKIIDSLRKEMPQEWENFKEIPISPNLASGVTLSTFHGCPPTEIEKIAVFLLKEAGLNTVIKLNPTLLGPKRVNEILHTVLGYHDVQVPEEAFTKDLQFDAAVEMIQRLREVAKQEGKHFGVKFNNTLVVQNRKRHFSDNLMYMSGRPLHVLAMNLVRHFREIFQETLPISFSAGIDSENVCQTVACNLVPITLCTDLLRPGGYSRMALYMQNLSQQMKETGALDRDAYILHAYPGKGKEAFIALLQEASWQVKESEHPELQKFSSVLKEKLAQAMPSQAFAQSLETMAQTLTQEEREATELLYKQAVLKAGLLNSLEYVAEVEKEERYTAFSNPPFSLKVDKKADRFDCLTAPCIGACPLHIHVPKYIEYIRQGKFLESLEVIRDKNPLPMVCGRVCNHPCEEVCRRKHWDKPVAIRALKRIASDWVEQHLPDYKETISHPKNDKIAIVGSGPAGLTAAYFLAKEGYPVTVFESLPEPGGMLRYGIPEFRLPLSAFHDDLKKIQQAGVEIRCNTKIGKEGIPLQKLQEEGYKVIFIAIGAYKSRKLSIEGEDAIGCMDCLTFLREIRSGQSQKIGKKVAVVGGGNAAIDAARTAFRADSEEVHLLYRRTRSQMPAAQEEIHELQEEGIHIHELTIPVRIITQDNHVKGIECVKAQLGAVDNTGRPRPVPIEGSNFTLDVDTILVAISQEPELENLICGMDIKISPNQTLFISKENQETTTHGIYAGGDVVRGADTLIHAMGDGRQAAMFIRQYLEGSIVPASQADFNIYSVDREYLFRIPWQGEYNKPSCTAVEERKNFSEVESVYTEEDAKKEAERCLQCDLRCEICVEVCPNRANFAFDVPLEQVPYPILGYSKGEIIPVGHGLYEIKYSRQIGNLADLCNECGNCDNFCIETGGPYKIKSAFYRSLQTLKESKQDGYYLEKQKDSLEFFGRIEGEFYRLKVLENENKAIFSNSEIKVVVEFSTGIIKETQCLLPHEGARISMEKFFIMRTLLKGIAHQPFPLVQ